MSASRASESARLGHPLIGTFGLGFGISVLLRPALLLLVPLAWWVDALTIWVLFVVAFAHGLLTVLFDVGYASYLPALVGREHLVEGNAKIAAVRSAASISGPGVAGPLVDR